MVLSNRYIDARQLLKKLGRKPITEVGRPLFVRDIIGYSYVGSGGCAGIGPNHGKLEAPPPFLTEFYEYVRENGDRHLLTPSAMNEARTSDDDFLDYLREYGSRRFF